MELSHRARQAIWIVFVGYLVLLGLSIFTDNALADIGVELAFIVILAGFAVFSYREYSHEPLGLLASVSLGGAAVGTAANLVLEMPAIAVTTDVLLLGGIGLYIYLRWQ